MAGEAALVERVLAYLPEGAETVAELYAGCGTFTFALAGRARVHAVESGKDPNAFFSLREERFSYTEVVRIQTESVPASKKRDPQYRVWMRTTSV